MKEHVAPLMLPRGFIAAPGLWGKISCQSFTLQYTSVWFSNQIKESQIQGAWWCIMLVEIIFPQSSLFIICTLTQISHSIVTLKNWLKTGKSKSKWDVSKHYICHNKADTRMAMIWVSHQCQQTYLCAERRDSDSHFICHCVYHRCSSFIIWAAWEEFAIIKPVL